MKISVVITAYNEGEELVRTLNSIQTNTSRLHEIIVIDDGSTDDSCNEIEARGAVRIYHSKRVGVGASRDEGARIATGDVISFLDGHQRLTPDCLDECSEIAIRKSAIVSPGIQGFEPQNKLIHGATFQLCPLNGFFSANWQLKPSWRRLHQSNALRGPGYTIPRNLYPKLSWIQGMTGWGGSEALLSLKAFFTRVPILFLRGPIAYHRFKRQFHYDVNWDEIWLNHALIARICFDTATWERYWYPELFMSKLSETMKEFLTSDEVLTLQMEFNQIKRRADCEFWRRMLKESPPVQLSQCSRLVTFGLPKV
ncbi:Putative glycosyltransferase EpsH [Polystyrenella longa]|uniref:Glycosyltransferase EpsH n=1 Tax=Polystyrenella longa TaxID=2528007 RepID=A0A518CTH7_9PLAN|nr:glycosyltransferase family 2 protein [Polystyrenella longa]QDU82523.1 Putative glycosyltransferase EpsH [Polystyrenella longa]